MRALALLLCLACGSSTPEAAPATTGPTYQRSEVPPQRALPQLENDGRLTNHVAVSSHLLVVRITEAGTLEETMPDGETRSYDYAWVEVVTTLLSKHDVIEPYGARFPIFHMTGFTTPEGDRGQGVPSPISRLMGRTGSEVIFVGDLPSAGGSSQGWVPEPLARDGYGAYVVQTRALVDSREVQSVMAVVGPQ